MNKVSASLYVHVPFCVHKCGYCDFNSWAETRREPQEQWVKGLKRQVNFWSKQLHTSNVEFDSVFFGGGTPSLLAEDLLAEMMNTLRAELKFSSNCEWTLECNPETVTREKLLHLIELGFNRLSLGLQSFQDAHLERLERHARRGDNFRALDLLQSYWPHRWSGDLMFGLPHQRLPEWAKELDELLQYNPSHVSAYQLTLTTERSKNWSQAPEDELLSFFDFTEERLGLLGLLRYEVSNFSRPGYESQHNLAYWKLKPFLGLGPGAAGVLSPSFFPNNRPEAVDPYFGAHQKNPDRFESWINGAGLEKGELGSLLKVRRGKDHLFELLMMGLRLTQGVQFNRIERVIGPERIIEFCSQMPDFIEFDRGFLKATPRGLRILDHLLPKLYDFIEKNAHANLDSLAFDPTFT